MILCLVSHHTLTCLNDVRSCCCEVVWTKLMIRVKSQSWSEGVAQLSQASLTGFYLSDICFNMRQESVLGRQVEVLRFLSHCWREQELNVSDSVLRQADDVLQLRQLIRVRSAWLITPGWGSHWSMFSNVVDVDMRMMMIRVMKICKQWIVESRQSMLLCLMDGETRNSSLLSVTSYSPLYNQASLRNVAHWFISLQTSEFPWLITAQHFWELFHTQSSVGDWYLCWYNTESLSLNC